MTIYTPVTVLKVASALRANRDFFADMVAKTQSRVDFRPVMLDLSPYVVKSAAPIPDVRSLLQPLQRKPVLGSSAQSRLQQSGWLSRPTLPGADGKSAKLPGSPGHAATNVIDRQGGLDPTGRTVDGNNAAGVSKQTGQIG